MRSDTYINYNDYLNLFIPSKTKNQSVYQKYVYF